MYTVGCPSASSYIHPIGVTKYRFTSMFVDFIDVVGKNRPLELSWHFLAQRMYLLEGLTCYVTCCCYGRWGPEIDAKVRTGSELRSFEPGTTEYIFCCNEI